MADNGIATKAAVEESAAAAAHAESVKRDDFTTGTVQFMFPAYGYNSFLQETGVLPRQLPTFNRYAFYTARDWTLLRTPHHDAWWADAVATAVTKAAAWGWEVESPVPLRRKRMQELLMYATTGVFVGYVPFITAHLRSFLLTGRAVIEIERETAAYTSRISALHHLNPLRCRFTDNPTYPVEYLDRQGAVHRLAYYQVAILGDNLDPTEGDAGLFNGAAERAYHTITTKEAAQVYLYEKLTGGRPLEIDFIQGITFDKMRDAITSAEHENARRGSVMYKGKVIVPIPGDVPVQRVTVPVAGLPDGWNYQEIHDNAAIEYSAAIGMDVNDLDPRLGQRMNIGSGAQSVVLDQKARGKGLAAWRVDFVQQMHRLVADAATTISWSENTPDDQIKDAQAKTARAQLRKLMQENQEITADQSRNLAVDAGDLPKEFLAADATAGGAVDSQDNPEAQPEQQQAEAADRGKTPQSALPPQETAENTPNPQEGAEERRKSADTDEALRRLLAGERAAAAALAGELIGKRPILEANDVENAG